MLALYMLLQGALSECEAETSARYAQHVKPVWGPSTNGFQLSIGTNKPIYDGGEVVLLSVKVRNLAFARNIEPLYALGLEPEVYDAQGRAAPAELGRWEIHTARHPAKLLRQNEVHETSYQLELQYKWTLGTYNVDVAANIYSAEPTTDGHTKPLLAHLTSNVARFEIQ